MRPPRGHDRDTAHASAEPRRLVDLLRGKGLTKDTLRELLMPDAATNLRAILTHSVASTQRSRDGRIGSEADRVPSEAGKVLAFRSKESPGSGPAIPATREGRDRGVRED